MKMYKYHHSLLMYQQNLNILNRTNVVKTVNKLAEKDDTKELLDFMREENDKNRKQQMEMYKLESRQFMDMMMVMFNSQQQTPSSARLNYPPR